MRTAIAIILLFLTACGGGDSPSSVQKTPKGVEVVGARLSQTQLEAIDTGLTRAFDAARASGYSKRIEYGFYKAYIEVCEMRNGVPAFRVRADEYDGTAYDVDPAWGIGVIYAVERVLNASSKGEFSVCPEIGIITNGSQYGAEHILIANNDPAYYEATKIHGPRHPLLPKP